MTDTTNTFGFEALYKIYCKEINKKQDVIILLIHWYLTRCGFRCIGIGDEKTFNVSQRGSELLPEGWNSQINYALRYIKDEKLYVLLGIKSDMDLLLNLMRHHDDSISNIQFPIEETVTSYSGLLETMIPSYHTILHSIQKDFVGALDSGNTKEVATQTNTSSNLHSFESNESQTRRSFDPLRVIGPEPDRPLRPEYDPARVGVRDLHPFGQGGGMIFDPFGGRPSTGRLPSGLGVPGRLPPGAIPPGARFDPFGPPDMDSPLRPPRRRPDDDHLPPPPFDMFN
ncbi:proteasome inhibitor PI31 subunit isoform X2 [Formica exsecta]|uniref:proteasome inhibitor PI31 subunit isoform X2 n=1 Tax=Formica exsecta TaxID=72781 RepID=UPI0011421B01|nr:proteasome inhibitor PI31 subunit isoform X2 [Formica exsecta]